MAVLLQLSKPFDQPSEITRTLGLPCEGNNSYYLVLVGFMLGVAYLINKFHVIPSIHPFIQQMSIIGYCHSFSHLRVGLLPTTDG